MEAIGEGRGAGKRAGLRSVSLSGDGRDYWEERVSVSLVSRLGSGQQRTRGARPEEAKSPQRPQACALQLALRNTVFGSDLAPSSLPGNRAISPASSRRVGAAHTEGIRSFAARGR